METKTQPFDDIKNLVSTLPDADADIAARIHEILATTDSDLNPLGRFDATIPWLGSWQGRLDPQIDKPLAAVFVGSHDVAHAVMGVAPATKGRERLDKISEGRAAARGLAAAQNAGFKVFDMGIAQPAADMSVGPSLRERECVAAIAFGMEAIAANADMIVLGDAGLGSATAAAGIARGLYGGSAEYWAGGQDSHAALRVETVEKAASVHKDILDDPLQVLRCFGGRDIAGIFGAILAARHQKIPVLLDGFVVCAAAAVLYELNPHSLDHCLAAHITVEPAHGALLDRIGKTPLLDLGVGIGDGSGAIIALGVLKTVLSGYHEMMDER